MGAVFFHGLRDVLPALLASFVLHCVAVVVGAFACLVGLLCYIKHKQRETMVYMKKFPGRTEHIPMLTTWSIHRTLSKEAHRLDVGTHLFQLSAGFSRMYQKHGMLRYYDATHPILVVFKADHIEELLTSNTVLKKGHEYDLLGPWLGTGLLTSSGSKWRSRRKLLTPAFHFRILEDFLPAVNEQSKVLVRKLGQLGKDRSCDVVPLVTLCALDIICDTIMGYTINAQSNQHSDYVQAIQVLGHSFTRRLESPLYWIDTIFRFSKPGRLFHQKIGDLHQFTLKVIRERKEELLSCPELQESLEETSLESDIYGVQGKTRKPFLDILLREHIKDPENFSEEDVREEVDTFMFEGHDTTAMGISWALYLIGLYSEHQELMHQELDAIFGANKTRPITSEDLKQMKYMECCLKESQRLYPSVPFISRMCEQDVMIGYFIDDVAEELECDKQAAITCYWRIADRFGRSPFVSIPDEPDDYLTSFCQVSENSEEFPEDATCKDYYAGCSDSDKHQFAITERGYAALQETATLVDSCQPIESLRECLDLDIMRKCDAHRPLRIGAFHERVTSRRRAAIQLRGCLQNAVNKCDSTKYGTAMDRLKRIANSIVDLNSPATRRAVAGNGASAFDATIAVVGAAVFICFLHADSYWQFN
ncbi:cytochrome P450 4c3-like isoform X3 [Dermacentor variabilis]|uniref:cytochrome P450 4c3-like isoform X3 n=1 Tax=Dermacentor variabilis TaxID=34621 RepID=UPI003F5B4379